MKKLKEMDKHMKRWIVILITALAAMLAVDVCAQEPQRGVKISGAQTSSAAMSGAASGNPEPAYNP